MIVSNSIAELRQQIHDDLRIQHPEWIEPNGECPECDFYEARLMEELDILTRTGSHESIAAIDLRAGRRNGARLPLPAPKYGRLAGREGDPARSGERRRPGRPV